MNKLIICMTKKIIKNFPGEKPKNIDDSLNYLEIDSLFNNSS